MSWWLWLLVGLVIGFAFGVFFGRVWVRASQHADLIELGGYAFALGYRQAVKKWGDRTPPRRVLDELREDYVALVQLQGKHFEFREPPPVWFEEIHRAADDKLHP